MEFLHLATNEKIENIMAAADYIATEVKDERVFIRYNPYIQGVIKGGVTLRPEYVNRLVPYMDIILSLGAQEHHMMVDFKFQNKLIRTNILVFLVFAFYECQKINKYPHIVVEGALDYLLDLIHVDNTSELETVKKYLPNDMKLIYLIDRLDVVYKSKYGIIVKSRDNNKLVHAVYKYNNLKEYLDEDKIKDVFVLDFMSEFRDDIVRIDVTSNPTRFDIKNNYFIKSEPLVDLYTDSGVKYYEQKLVYASGVETRDFFDILQKL